MVEIATDKVDSEVPAPSDGVILEILVQEGEVAAVGQVIAIIGAEGETAASVPVSAPKAEPAPASIAIEQTINEAVTAVSTPVDFSDSDRFYSPLVKSIAKEEGIALNELENISGTGQGGRVTKKDILSYVENRSSQPAATPQAAAPTPAVTAAPKPAAAPKPTPSAASPATSVSGDTEVIEMDRMRKMISEHMVRSKHTSPHVTSFVEADVTNIVNWRNKIKNDFEKREGQKITFTPIFIEAIARAIKDYPMINITVEGDKIIRKKNINIGMAAALPSGNLIVPVIKNADRFNLLGLTQQVNDLASRARANKLAPDDIAGGTYTVTNVGTFGNVMGTPIINQPQVAILAVGAIRKKPAVIETAQGDYIGIRHMMFLSHSYDHRVVDGALGGMFVKRVAEYLEQWDVNREI
jgi:2-oxoglutarate dehydrogenase E2 component (dihydrolipoamide succinyltransferase)